MRGAEPIFVHSLHRSASTYIFNVFRRAKKDGRSAFVCFQEPIHEQAFLARENPALLLDSRDAVEKMTLAMRHPGLNEGYYKELSDIHAYWKDVIAQEIIYADYFGGLAIDKTAAYLKAIVCAAKRRAVIQECRTPLRIAALKARVGGTHIHLWRNPWDQWWSLKVDSYFDAVHQIVLNAPGAPAPILLLKKRIGFEPYSGTDVLAQLNFYRARRLTPEASYLVTFTLLMLSLIESRNVVDIAINIDRLSTYHSYREQILEELTAKGIEGLNFSDCKVPQAPYCKSDEAFFLPLEECVLEWLRATLDRTLVDWAYTQRIEAAPKCPPNLEGSDVWLAETARRGDLIRSIERRDAAELQQLRQRLITLKDQLAAIRASTSWRMTAPLRGAGRVVNWLVSGIRAWLSLRAAPARDARGRVLSYTPKCPLDE